LTKKGIALTILAVFFISACDKGIWPLLKIKEGETFPQKNDCKADTTIPTLTPAPDALGKKSWSGVNLATEIVGAMALVYLVPVVFSLGPFDNTTRKQDIFAATCGFVALGSTMVVRWRNNLRNAACDNSKT
jgi:hypothetical protein